MAGGKKLVHLPSRDSLKNDPELLETKVGEICSQFDKIYVTFVRPNFTKLQKVSPKWFQNPSLGLSRDVSLTLTSLR